MAGAKNHDYHILPPDIWPLVGAFSALTMAIGGIMWMHGGHVGHPNGGGIVFFIGVAAVLTTMLSWWTNVIREAHAGLSHGAPAPPRRCEIRAAQARSSPAMPPSHARSKMLAGPIAVTASAMRPS